MTPSLPTFSMACEMSSPISMLLLAEMAPTWAISRLPLVSVEESARARTTTSTPLSMPRRMPIGLVPAVTFFSPSP